jgi:hypothetical protein
LPKVQRILAIDYGTKRVGFAYTVNNIIFTLPQVNNDELLFDKISDIIKLHKINKIFVGKSEGRFAKVTQNFVDKIKFSSIDYDLVYYNSQGYFMGSGGGEVFSYIVDLENKQVYSAHLVVESQSSTYLFISDNTQIKELINFFTLTFKKDYPSLTIVDDDIVVE